MFHTNQSTKEGATYNIFKQTSNKTYLQRKELLKQIVTSFHKFKFSEMLLKVLFKLLMPTKNTRQQSREIVEILDIFEIILKLSTHVSLIKR
jgi:hypothetical protein